jgi:hypothetical protein
MAARPKALIVTQNSERADLWMGWSRRAGYMTLGCVGPGLTLDCPRLHGNRCGLREAADVAIVDLDCDAEAGLCTRLPDDGGTVFVPRGGFGAGARVSIMERVAAADRRRRREG